MARRCSITSQGSQFGHNVSHSNRKTKRRFFCNLQPISFKSDSLNQVIQLRVAVASLRTVEHRGGIDAFLLSASDCELGKDALKLKKQIKRFIAKKSPDVAL